MIEEVKVWVASCDVCKEPRQNHEDYMPMFIDESECLDDIRNDEWLIGDGIEGEAGKHYCPECWSRDDEDVVHIKTAAAGSSDPIS